MSWLEIEGRDLSLKVEGDRQRSFVFEMLEKLPAEERAAAEAKFETFSPVADAPTRQTCMEAASSRLRTRSRC